MPPQHWSWIERAVPYVLVPELNIVVVHAGIPTKLKEIPPIKEYLELSKGKQKAFNLMMYQRYNDQDGKFVNLSETDYEKHTFWANDYDGRFGMCVFGHSPFLGTSEPVKFFRQDTLEEHFAGPASAILDLARRDAEKGFRCWQDLGFWFPPEDAGLFIRAIAGDRGYERVRDVVNGV